MEAKKQRLTLGFDPAIQCQLRVAATVKVISIRRYCQTTLDKKLAQKEANGLTDLPSDQSDTDRLPKLREKHFEAKTLLESGTDFIRQVRENRDTQL